MKYSPDEMVKEEMKQRHGKTKRTPLHKVQKHVTLKLLVI